MNNVAKTKSCSSHESKPCQLTSASHISYWTVPNLLTLVKFSRVNAEKPPAVSFTGLLALSIKICKSFLNLLFAMCHSQWYAAFRICELWNVNIIVTKANDSYTYYIFIKKAWVGSATGTVDWGSCITQETVFLRAQQKIMGNWCSQVVTHQNAYQV